MIYTLGYLSAFALCGFGAATCVSSGDQNTINSLFQSGGAGTVVQICSGTTISVTDTITFTADNQEISTSGYPTDSSRAIIHPASGSNVSMLLNGYGYDGLRIKNIQFDGQRPSLGFVQDGGATIELGQQSNGIEISNIVSKNARAWSCLHLIQGGSDNPCTNVTISNNQIGPCGNEGTNSAGAGLWADGISFACQDSLIENNQITGSTDGGIVLFGAPGTTVQGNTIISSSTDSGFGAINMVDYLYDGSYANVVVTNNTIIGQKLFNAGIAIGAFAWSFNDNSFLHGPATVTNNVFSGNIPFAIGVNGWTGGLSISGNDISNLNSPSSDYSDANRCVSATKDLWQENAHLVYYPAGLQGSNTLQSDFVAAGGNSTNLICTTPPLPSKVNYGLNQLNVGPNTVLANLHNGILTQYQGDSNIVTYNTSTGSYVAVWASGHTSTACESNPDTCSCDFQGDGNFVTYAAGTPLFVSNTAGKGNTLTFLNERPWIQIADSAGNVIWDTTDAQ